MTAPLVPAHVDLRDFPYMPLDVVRLRDSRLVSHTTGEGFRCAVLLWCVAWHQVPAGSLPDDDLQLAQYAGFGRVVKEWKKLRAEALHGWVLCDDGRWYHPTVAEKALEAWTERLKQRYRTECARIKKAAQRAKVDAEYPSFEEWSVSQDKIVLSPGTEQESPQDVAGETPSKGREGKGREGNNSTEPNGSAAGAAPAEPIPVDPIWGTGLAFLIRKGIPEKPARSLIGQLRKTAGDVQTGSMLADAESQDITDPAPWLMKAAAARAETGDTHATRTQGRESLVDHAAKRAQRILGSAAE